MNWAEIAPKRADWERLNKAFKDAGLPLAHWVNGEPVWDKPVDKKKIEQAVTGTSQKAKPKKVHK